MKTKVEERLGLIPTQICGNETGNYRRNLNFPPENMVNMTAWKDSKKPKEPIFQWNFHRYWRSFIIDMSILKSCQHGLGAPLIFWASVFLLLLTKGVCSTSDEQMDYRTAEPATDIQKVYPFMGREPFLFNYLRSLLQKEQQGELPTYDIGSELGENSLDKNKFPPFINRLRAITSRINMEKDKISKKDSYMSVCHFKVCNMG